MKNKMIFYNWLVLFYVCIDIGSLIIEYFEIGKKIRLVCYGRFIRKIEILIIMLYV